MKVIDVLIVQLFEMHMDEGMKLPLSASSTWSEGIEDSSLIHFNEYIYVDAKLNKNAWKNL